MPILHAIVLGITQGLSEFLPISSSGHLILVPWLFDWKELTLHPDLNKTFDVALHVGTFVGAVAYFRTDLARLVGAGLTSIRARSVATPDQRLAWLLLLSAIPGAATGALLENVIEEHAGAPILIGTMLIVFGLVLLAADRLAQRRDVGEFGLGDAVWLGLAQAGALQPGVSRSGITISAARALGFGRDAAARVSFLMSLPIIGGAGLYKGLKVATGAGIPAGFGAAFAWGMLASAVTGFAAVWLVLRYVRTRSFAPFVVYRCLAGVFVIAVAIAR
jgi:undecaprenyl-diphosphatase